MRAWKLLLIAGFLWGCSPDNRDLDMDGVNAVDDCNDEDASLLAIAGDGDCDGALTADDCDDADAASTTVATDGDCDTVLTADDCDDADDTSTTIATDADCDGVLTADDCDDDDALLLGDDDCDGDGFSNEDELAQGTDPNDASDRPYLGGWPLDPCADTIQESGYDEGEVAPDFSRKDQFGDDVRLYDFCDHIVLMISVAYWDGAGQAATSEYESWYQEFKDENLIVIALLTDANGNDQTPASWAADFGQTFPVLDDSGAGITNSFGTLGYYPNYHVLGPGAVVALRTGAGHSALSYQDVKDYVDALN